jgi:DNA-directed RNA polymerase III subunit RPC2
LNGIAQTLQEGSFANVLTENQAIEYIATKLNSQKNAGKPWQQYAEVRDIFKNVILAHIPMSKNMPFFAKCRYMGLMIRRVIEASDDPSKLDDKDYYGNKRLELAGSLVSLLFEDLFKTFQYDLKR